MQLAWQGAMSLTWPVDAGVAHSVFGSGVRSNNIISGSDRKMDLSRFGRDHLCAECNNVR
jgi:hypothetical protein